MRKYIENHIKIDLVLTKSKENRDAYVKQNIYLMKKTKYRFMNKPKY